MRKILDRYKSIILYVLFGGLTTLINIVVYYICSYSLSFNTIISNVIAWILSVLFAYITNKIWVFESRIYDIRGLLKEIASFFGCRMATGILDILIMYVFVDIWLFPRMIMKCLSNVLVIVINYIASRLFIFND